MNNVKDIPIVDVARKIGFELIGRGNKLSAKENVIRSEKTSSITFYKDTNSWSDFGSGKGGSVIDLYL